MKKIIISCLLVLFLFAVNSYAEKMNHPSKYVDKGACPFECCVYGSWQVMKDTVLYAKPDKKSRIVGKCTSGSNVTALMGEVHTWAAKFIIKRKFETYYPGDILWVYTYTGEGNFKVWAHNKFTELNLGFSPYGGSTGRRCERGNDCVGELEKEMEIIWWIKIKTPDGKTGWTFESANFSGNDRCG